MTSPPAAHLDPTNPLDRGHRRLYRRIGTVVGAALLVAAIVGVVRNEAIGASLQAAWHYTLIRERSREGCFKAFRLNHWLGFSIFAGVVVDLLAR
jgi:ATP sulfurylase